MSQNTPIEKDVNGQTFTFTMLPPKRARHWSNRIFKLAFGGDSADSITGILSGIDPDLLEKLQDEMEQYCMIDKVPLEKVHSTIFGGKPGLYTAWFLTAVEVQYADFLLALSAWLKSRFGENYKEKAAKFLSTSIG